MKRHLIPHTDLEVSALCLGASSFGTDVKGADADRLASAFIAAGGNFFDTAHCYAFWKENGDGASERELGACLRRLGVQRQVVVGTKGGHPAFGEKYRRPDDFLSERVIASDVDDSLNRLGVERIDLYYLHRDDGRTLVEDIVETLNREIQRGRIRHIAASNWSIPRLAAANDYAARKGLRGFVASQMQWSLAQPNWKPTADPTTRFVTDEEIAWHMTSRIPLVTYSATASGYFAGRGHEKGSYANDANKARFERTQQLSAQLGCTPTQLALAWLMRPSPTVIPLFGTTSLEHLEEAVASVKVVLSEEQARWLRDG